MITLAMFMKMGELQKQFIQFCIVPVINRDNAVNYALYALLHIEYLYTI